MNKIRTGLAILKKVKNWQIYIADYLKFKQGEIIYETRDGLKYKLRGGSNDRNIFNDVIIRRVYNPPGFEIKKGDLVLDIGAHIGLFSVLASKNASKVFAFEPEPQNFSLLSKNKSINKIDNIFTFNKAVSGKKGSAELFLNHSNMGNNSFYQHLLGKKTDKINVETINLKDFFHQNEISQIDFLKVDCEGSEYEVFFNCPTDLLKKIKSISMEYHNIDERRNMDSMKNFLENAGFKVEIPLNDHPTAKGDLGMIYASRQAEDKKIS